MLGAQNGYQFFHAFAVTTCSVFVCGTGGRADEMLVEAPLHEQQSALATVFIEKQTRVCMRNRETINSFLDIITEKALQHMNDPSMLVAAIAVRQKLENATTAMQVADVILSKPHIEAGQVWSGDSCTADKHCTSKIGANQRDQEDARGAIGKSKIEQNEPSINLQEKSSTFSGRTYSEESPKCKQMKGLGAFCCDVNTMCICYCILFMVTELK